MRTQASTAWILKWAVAGVVAGAFAPLAMAQYQTDNSTGRARDANNRLGSGGYNGASNLPNNTVTSDDMVYSNVTGGKGFRGPLNSTDARAFRGTTPGNNVNTFVRDSVGANQDPNQAFTPRPFYTDSTVVPAPPGFETQASVADFNRPRTDLQGPAVGDYRLNDATVNPLLNPPVLPGDMDILRPPTVSPLTPAGAGGPALPGLLTWQAQTGLPTDDVADPQRGALRRLRINETSIRSMQEELASAAEQPQDSGGRISLANGLTSPENPLNPTMESGVGAQTQAKPMIGSLNTNATVRQNLLNALPTAAKQSTQYAELQRRLHMMRPETGSADQIAAQKYNDQLRLKAKQEEEAKAATAGQLMQPNATGAPGEKVEAGKKPPEVAQTPSQPPINNQRLSVALKAKQTETKPESSGVLAAPTVLRITSFAQGVKAAGLRDLLEHAETSMRDGRFTAALDNYDAAMSVAPNNPLILIARANAELGAGYYARAQTHIEQIFAADSSLLLAQYDLRVFFGEERLQYLVRDLKDVAQSEPRQPRPLFLLAYIAYNTNNSQSAADYLALAEQRGGKDPLFDKLREFWKLPKAGAGGQTPQSK